MAEKGHKNKTVWIVIAVLLVFCIGMSIPITIKRNDDFGTEYTEYRNGWSWLDAQYHKMTKTDIVEFYGGNIHAYGKLANGSYICEGNTYQYCLVISGTMPNAKKESTFVYLSNLSGIPFESAWKAAGYSSNTEDYFDAKEALLVDVH